MSGERDLGFEESEGATDEDEIIERQPLFEVERVVGRRVIEGQVSEFRV